MPSDWDPWEHYHHGPPLPADGIRARSQRGKFGQTWWAGRWLATLERICGEGRLARGRSYARRGQVVSLEAGPDGVSATVQGSRTTPYDVSIRLRTLPDAVWAKVVEAMAARALYSAKLLAGEMPEQIEEVFVAAGASLLPGTRRDLLTQCSRPDSANPCKHVAAVYYLLGERFDLDPFLMFELRGRRKDILLAALRDRRGDVPTEAEVEGEAPAGPEPGVLASDISTSDFWRNPGGLPSLTFSFEPPPIDALAVRRLGPPPFASDPEDFTARMERIYRLIGDQARRLALSDPGEPSQPDG